MKRIYFVRHGESESNVTGVVQGLYDPLSEAGELQALRIAERAQSIDFSALISSDATRARMTADAVHSTTKVPIVESELFREVKRPTSLVGLAHTREEYISFLRAEYDNRLDSAWRFEDEEIYGDLYARAQSALQFLLDHEAEELLVVTHGHFLRFLLATMIMGTKLTPDIWHAFATRFVVTNTGITIASHEPIPWKKEEKHWRVLTWNDHAHFAE